ncbi:HepT-like ribonuclease domain-containing protein [Thermococcus barossii]|uniref:Nucleotidyltransferase n=1 Tax=Thermococcus barossii TaxID=54077 RepID=A0A2Z2MIH8_9EURY|nr:DUF86 domain-containing protein [Thermococcus barossii]ASJ04562.1 hypothetical protein A3L01_03955 [Thermococcus barossii]
MSKRDPCLFLDDILEAIFRIEEYTEGYEFEDFIRDRKTVDAVLRNLEVIGEAARYVPEEIKEQHADVPWKRIIGLRNVVIHHYFGVDLNIVWTIVRLQLPDLKKSVEKIVEELC